jgi:hypothetical protein
MILANKNPYFPITLSATPAARDPGQGGPTADPQPDDPGKVAPQPKKTSVQSTCIFWQPSVPPWLL